MSVNVRKIFKAHCGSEARFIAHRFRARGQHRTVVVGFSIGKRNFELDGVIHVGNTPDERLSNAVVRIAGLAKNLKATLAAPDGTGSLQVDRLLS